MAELRLDCVELAEKWKTDHADCFHHCSDLIVRTDEFVSRIMRMVTGDPNVAVGTTIAEVEGQLRQSLSGQPLSGSRATNSPNSLSGLLFRLRWRGRNAVHSGTSEIARVFGHDELRKECVSHFDGRVFEEMFEVSRQIELTGDALDILSAIDCRPSGHAAGLQLSGAMTDLIEVLRPYDKGACIVRLLDAHGGWNNEQYRLKNWLLFHDRSLRVDPVETELIGRPRLLARYKLLKEEKHAVQYSSIVDRDDLWQTKPINRTDESMQRGFKDLQQVLNAIQDCPVEVMATQKYAKLVPVKTETK